MGAYTNFSLECIINNLFIIFGICQFRGDDDPLFERLERSVAIMSVAL